MYSLYGWPTRKARNLSKFWCFNFKSVYCNIVRAFVVILEFWNLRLYSAVTLYTNTNSSKSYHSVVNISKIISPLYFLVAVCFVSFTFSYSLTSLPKLMFRSLTVVCLLYTSESCSISLSVTQDFPLLQVLQEIQYFIFRYGCLKIHPTKNISLCEPKDTATCVRVPKEMERREGWEIEGEGEGK